MEQNFKRISAELKLSEDSRERIRSQITSYRTEQEEIPMKKSVKIRVLAVIAAVAAAMTMTVAAAEVVQQFRNHIIIHGSGVDEVMNDMINNGMFTSSDESGNDTPRASGFVSPTGTPPLPLEKRIEFAKLKSDDWSVGEKLYAGTVPRYVDWEFVEVLSYDPVLRSRRVWSADGMEKMEYTAENPENLLDTMTGRVTVDLSWMNDRYHYVPDANWSYVVTDEHGNFFSEEFNALYAKPDESGYVEIEICNTAPADLFARVYVVDGSYETVYYYTTPDGYEFLITKNTGYTWASCYMSHTYISLSGAYLGSGEIEDILDNLSLSISKQ